MTIISLDDFKERVQNLSSIDNTLDKTGVNRRFIEENNKLTVENKVPFFIRNPLSPIPRLGQKLYRVTQEFSGFQESDVSFYQHPPDGHTKQQRCNLPRNPVFYCSDVWVISLFEVLQGQDSVTDKTFYFSEWKVTVSRQWQVLSFIFGGVPQNNPAYSYIQQTHSSVVEKYKTLMLEKDIADYMDFYHAEFTRVGSHKISSIISHQFLYDNDQEEGDFIFYPSFQAKKEGNNYAFNKKVIESGEIVLSNVYKVHIKQLTKTSDLSFDWSYSLERIGKNLGGSVSWQKPTKQDFDEFNKHFPASI